jgi:hypothetical protein
MSTVAGIIDIGHSYKSGKELEKASKEQVKMADEQKKLDDMETAEELRRLELKQKETLAAAKASAGAGGGGTGGSTATFLNKMQSEFGAELDWLRETGATAAEIRHKGGLLEASLTKTKARGSYAEVFAGAGRMAERAQRAWG